MAEEKTHDTGQGARINMDDAQEMQAWAKKFNASVEQVEEAVRTVGTRASDVEDHLKGSRATTNSERVHDALASDAPGSASSKKSR